LLSSPPLGLGHVLGLGGRECTGIATFRGTDSSVRSPSAYPWVPAESHARGSVPRTARPGKEASDDPGTGLGEKERHAEGRSGPAPPRAGGVRPDEPRRTAWLVPHPMAGRFCVE